MMEHILRRKRIKLKANLMELTHDTLDIGVAVPNTQAPSLENNDADVNILPTHVNEG